MEIEVLQESLSKALNHTSRLANQRAELSILGNILIKTSGSQVMIASTNLEIANTQRVNAKVIKQGSITVPAKLIAEFVQNLSKGKLKLSVKQNTLTITSDDGVSKINGMNDDEFPEIPYIESDSATSLQLPIDLFKTAVNQTIICVSSDTTRQVLTGVYWRTIDNKLYFAATDGYRLAERYLIDYKDIVDAIIPADALQEVLRTLSDDQQDISILLEDTQVQFTFGDTIITSRLIDGNFPDYRQLIPAKGDTNCQIDSSEFSRVVKIARLFSRDSGGAVTLSVDDNTLTINSIASELGENTSKITIKTTGDSSQITLNSKYINDMLNVIASKDIRLSFSGKIAPSVFTPIGEDEEYKHIIMPIKN